MNPAKSVSLRISIMTHVDSLGWQKIFCQPVGVSNTSRAYR